MFFSVLFVDGCCLFVVLFVVFVVFVYFHINVASFPLLTYLFSQRLLLARHTMVIRGF